MKRLLGIAAVVTIFAAPISSASADTSVVGQWHFDEGSGTVAADSSGYGDDGTVGASTPWVPGRFGSALSFDGTNSLVQIPDGPQLEPASAVTVSAWVERSGSPGKYRYIVAKGETGCNSASYGLYSGATGGLMFYVANGGSGDTYVLSPDAGAGVWDGSWHLTVGTYDGTSVRLYVDGNQVGSGTPRTGPLHYPSSDSNSLLIGGYPFAQNDPGCLAGGFSGLIDEITIWNRALSADDVSTLMSTSSGGSPGTVPTPAGDSGSGHGPATGSGPTGQKGKAPQIGHFRVSQWISTSRRTGTAAVAGAMITYTLTQAAQLSFVVTIARPGTVRGGKCVKRSKATVGGRHCVLNVPLARFAHAGKAGTNSLRMSTRVWRKLAPHRYRLEATPSAHGQAGKTVATTFVVPR